MNCNGTRDFQKVADNERPCHLVRMEMETVEEVRTHVRMNHYLGNGMTAKNLNRDIETMRQKLIAMGQFLPNDVTRLKYSKTPLMQHLVI
jgi:hypothetical protein